MKWLKLTFLTFAASVASIPISRNNENKEGDWQLVPDNRGNLHLVDIGNTDDSMLMDGGGQNTGARIRNALNRGNFNVFTIDWGLGATTLNYVQARNRVNDVGAVTAQFIDFLNNHGLPYHAIGIIGHSLGAHVAGAAGKRTRSRIASIVGLDPARPLFALSVPADRLDHTNATYVESHITDAGRLDFEHPVAHANYYPNWGTAHARMWKRHSRRMWPWTSSFMKESINPSNVFGAIRCRDFDDIRTRNCVVSGPSRRMGGEPVNDVPSAVGSVYFLATNPDRPFAQGPR